MVRQKLHLRRSKRGKVFTAGSRSKHKSEITNVVRKEVLMQQHDDIVKELNKEGSSKLPHLGVFHVKIKPAQKGGEKREVFGKMITTKAKPKRKMIKFRASKELLEAI